MGETECWNHRGLHLFQLHAPLTFGGEFSGGKTRDTKQPFSHWLLFQKSSPAVFFFFFLSSTLKHSAWFPELSWGLHVDDQTRTVLAERCTVRCSGVWCWRTALGKEPAHCISAHLGWQHVIEAGDDQDSLNCCWICHLSLFFSFLLINVLFNKCCGSQLLLMRLHPAIGNPLSRQKKRGKSASRKSERVSEREGERQRETLRESEWEREGVSAQRDVLRFSDTCDKAIQLHTISENSVCCSYYGTSYSVNCPGDPGAQNLKNRGKLEKKSRKSKLFSFYN